MLRSNKNAVQAEFLATADPVAEAASRRNPVSRAVGTIAVSAMTVMDRANAHLVPVAAVVANGSIGEATRAAKAKVEESPRRKAIVAGLAVTATAAAGVAAATGVVPIPRIEASSVASMINLGDYQDDATLPPQPGHNDSGEPAQEAGEASSAVDPHRADQLAA